MKIAISYPPILNELGQKAMVSQNRNVQYFKAPTYLLPVTYAQAATWLKQLGHDVYWDDGNAALKSFDQWYKDLLSIKPDVIVLESTTPVMKFYWELTVRLKRDLPTCIIIMTGYHSMRRPSETLENSKTDIIIKSNHIDFVLKDLVAYLNKTPNWRAQLELDIEGLVYKNDSGKIIDTGQFKPIEPLDKSPIIDRDLVQWKNYAYENGNFLRTPGTYATSVIRDCTFGKCTFCRYNGPDITFSQMSIERSLDEYEMLIKNYGVKEIFDDSGVWYRGKEAREFARGIIKRGLHKKGCYFGINTRFEYLDEETIKLLAKANFRFILIGFEAADEFTLRKLNKTYDTKYVEQCLRWMTKYGLFPHITVMVGYYWQTQKQLDLTVSYVKKFLLKGLARSMQATICTPLDYTPYHLECIKEGVLLTEDYNDFDMSKIIVKTPIPHERYYEAIRQMYGIIFNPLFILRQIMFLFKFRVKDWEYLFIYGVRAIRRVRNHVFNLTRNQ